MDPRELEPDSELVDAVDELLEGETGARTMLEHHQSKLYLVEENLTTESLVFLAIIAAGGPLGIGARLVLLALFPFYQGFSNLVERQVAGWGWNRFVEGN